MIRWGVLIKPLLFIFFSLTQYVPRAPTTSNGCDLASMEAVVIQYMGFRGEAGLEQCSLEIVPTARVCQRRQRLDFKCSATLLICQLFSDASFASLRLITVTGTQASGAIFYRVAAAITTGVSLPLLWLGG